MKCVQVETQQFMLLKDNELMGSIGEHVLPVTCNSGADIIIVPEECVPQKNFTGDTCEVASFNRKISSGKIFNIVVTVGGRQFPRKAVAQPGADLGWTVYLSLPYRVREDRNFVTALMAEKFDSPEITRRYLPPILEDGRVKTSLMVSDANTDVAPVHMGDTGLITEDTQSVEIECQKVATDDSVPENVDVREEVVSDEVADKEVGNEMDASQLVEADGVSLSGSADREGYQENLILEGIHELGPEPLLAKETSIDPMLDHIRCLAKLEKEGYHARRNVIYRTRLGRHGEPIEQICVPIPFRQKCLEMAHGKFSHQGRNKMVELL